MDQPAPWRVLLLGGTSGTGKSTLAQALARQFGTAHLQTDDIRMALQQVTDATNQPALHYFVSQPGIPKPGIWTRPPEQLCEGLIDVARVVSASLTPVIAHHLASAERVIIEGDAILPSVLKEFRDPGVPFRALRAVYLIDDDFTDVAKAMVDRGSLSEQLTQARMYHCYGQWLRAETCQFGVPVVCPHPWATLFERVSALLT